MKQVIRRIVTEFEDDVNTGQYVVGRGGFPNASGVLECDATVMDGCTGGFGAVAALQGIATPICVARKVMEHSKHNFLVGEGALTFAKDMGFKQEDNNALVGESSLSAFKKHLAKKESPKTHDTLGLIVQDANKDITAGVSSSGIAFKHPGRVGDSPLPGGGLYVDQEVGAACVTGDGDEILKYCPSYHVVHAMRAGASPAHACQSAVDIIQSRNPGCEIGIIALNKQVMAKL